MSNIESKDWAFLMAMGIALALLTILFVFYRLFAKA